MMWKRLIDTIKNTIPSVQQIPNICIRTNGGVVELTKTAFERGRLVRRIVMLGVSCVWVWILFVCVDQYYCLGTLDTNFSHIAMAVTGVAATCYSFYFTTRSKENMCNEQSSYDE